MSTPSSLARVRYHALKLRTALRPRFSPSKSLHHLQAEPNGLNHLPDGFWFKGSMLHQRSSVLISDPRKPPDERTVKLGATLRTLQSRLPSLLQYPLPSEILSPQITLHLFPSTHPHLPTVSGRVAYVAALWTSPLAWGRVPIVGNVKLEILSERMIKKNNHARGNGSGNEARAEQLVVRWRTCGKTKGRGTGGFYKGIGAGASEQVDKITEFLGGGSGEDDSKEFTGLFIFEFDEEGRIVSHTIEHAQHGGSWDKGVGAKVVGLTDWLLGGLKGNGDEGVGGPCPAFWGQDRRR